MAVISVYWRAFKHLNHRGYIYVWANILWILLTLPIVTAPAAWAGLVYMSHRAQTRPQVTLQVFWEGFRLHLWHSLPMGIVTVVILIVNFSNLWMTRFELGWQIALFRLIWFSIPILWLSTQLYMWSIYDEMEEPSVWGAWRNAVLMVFRNPFFTLGIWFGIVLIGLISVVFTPLWMLLTGSLFAIIASQMTLNRLNNAGYKNPEHTRQED